MKTKILSASLALSMLLPGCFWVNDDDAGVESDMAYLKVALHGQRVTSPLELEVLTKLAEADGRDAVVNVLLHEPEFAEHWTRVLMARRGVALSGGEKPQDTSCYTKHALATHLYDDLVTHLRYQSWKTPFCPSPRGWIAPASTLPAPPRPAPTGFSAGDYDTVRREFDRIAATPGAPVRSALEPVYSDVVFTGPNADAGPVSRGFGFEAQANNCESFTMADAYAAAIAEDRMDALLRVALVPMATMTTSQGTAASKFLEHYVERDPSCVACHGTNYSTTNAAPRNEDWDRFAPANLVDLEATVFSYTDGSGYHDGSIGGDTVGDRVVGLFRGDGWRASNGLFPFGIDGACAAHDDRSGFATKVETGSVASFAGLDGTAVGIGALVDQFAIGVVALQWDQLSPAPYPSLDGGAGNAADGQTAFNSVCQGCHDGQNAMAPEGLATYARTMPPARIHQIAADGAASGLMGGYGDDTASDVTAYLTGLNGYVHPQVYTTRAAGFAHLTAMAFVDDVYAEIAGRSLLMDHGFPRNEDAAAVLDHLTRVFVDNGWSLQTLVGEIVTSTFANRRAPADSPFGAYGLPMLFEPMADALPVGGGAGEDENGQGDIVHRWSVPNLLRQLEVALLWPQAPMFPSGGHADLAFQEDFGATIDSNKVGFDQVVTSALLAWETEMGSCTNPGPDPDLIDVLTDPVHGLTLEQAMLEVKGRLVGDWFFYGDPWSNGGGGIAAGPPQDELNLAASLTPFALSDPASDDPDAVRDFCGVVTMSPQFLLMGLPSDGGTFDPAIPCVDARCTYLDHCKHYAAAGAALGHNGLSCGIGGLTSR